MHQGRLILAFVPALLVASCGGKSPATPDASESSTTTIDVRATVKYDNASSLPDYSFAWDVSAGFRVFEEADSSFTSCVSQNVSSSDGDRTASFKAFFPKSASGPFSYCSVYPSSCVKGYPTDPHSVRLGISANQSAILGALTHSSDLFISDSAQCASQPSSLEMPFSRISALGKISLIACGDVSSIEFSAVRSGESVCVAGTTSFDLYSGSPASRYCDIYAERRIKISCKSSSSDANKVQSACFICWPFTLLPGDTYSISVSTTDGKTTTKDFTIAEGRSLDFSASGTTSLTVDLTPPDMTVPDPLTGIDVKTSDGSANCTIDQDSHTVYIRHIPEPEMIKDILFSCSETYSAALDGSWPAKTLSCTSPQGTPASYDVVLTDYVGADDYFRTYAGNFESDWTIMWADEFKTPDYDHVAWYQCNAGPSYWNEHMDPSNHNLVTMHPGQDAKHVGHVALWAMTGSNATAQKTYNGWIYPRHDGYITGGIQGGIKNGVHYYHPTLPPVGAKAYRVDIRMSAQKAKGFWPAVWMVSPDSISPYLVAGEMDLAEVLTNKNKVYQTCHNIYSNTNSKTFSQNTVIAYADGDDNWIMYSVVVDDESLRYYMNGTLKMTYANDGEGNMHFPYNQGYHYQIILSAQLGSSDWMWFGDTKPDGTDLPVCMKVDFVRIYQK